MGEVKPRSGVRRWFYTSVLNFVTIAPVFLAADKLGVPTTVKAILVGAAGGGAWWLAVHLGWQQERVPPETGKPPRDD